MANKIEENDLVISPAYGRDYKSAKDAISDFVVGKDFKMESIGHGGMYCSIRDFEKGVEVLIRYSKLTKVTVCKVG